MVKNLALGAEDAYVSFPEVTANILKAKQEYLDTEAARLKENMKVIYKTQIRLLKVSRTRQNI